MLFKQAGLPFRYRKAPGTAGRGNYDIDYLHPAWVIPVETKAKDLGTKRGRRTLEDSLSHAANCQLPADRPGIIAIRLPSHWARSIDEIKEIERWIGIWLSRHETIARVIALTEAPAIPEEGPFHAFAVLDVPNHKQMFGAELGGRLFTSSIHTGKRWKLFKEVLSLVPRPNDATVETGQRMLNEGRALSPEYLGQLLQEAGIRPRPDPDPAEAK